MKLNSLLLTILIPTGIWTNYPNQVNDPPAPQPTEETNAVFCESENSTFKNGEEIVYKIYYNWNFVWLSAGEVSFKVSEDKSSYHISVVGKTYPSYEWFYKVEDYYDSWIDKKTLLPKTFERDVTEGKYTQYNKFIFDHPNRKVTTYIGSEKETAERGEVSIGNCMHDMISIMYFVRNQDIEGYKKGESFPVDVFLEEEYKLNVRVLEKDEKQRIRGLGKFSTHLISPDVIGGEVFEEGTQMKVWVSADNNKVPLLIESPVSVGSIKAVLKEYKGLKYDLTSQL